MNRLWAHTPVLTQEVVSHWGAASSGTFLDCTLGAGGHTAALLKAHPRATVVGLDVDGDALDLAQRRFVAEGVQDRVALHRVSYTEAGNVLAGQRVQGILADFGANSLGFSFLHDGPLDCRFDVRQELTAADIVNTWGEAALGNLFQRYGEERHARRIAAMIMDARPLATTRQLADLIAGSLPRVRRAKTRSVHPATRVFQALRIMVNGELDNVAALMDAFPTLLAPGGRACFISFHSLEDNVVKLGLRKLAKRPQPGDDDAPQPAVKLHARRGITAGPEEAEANPRARSARLRVCEKLETL